LSDSASPGRQFYAAQGCDGCQVIESDPWDECGRSEILDCEDRRINNEFHQERGDDPADHWKWNFEVKPKLEKPVPKELAPKNIEEPVHA